MLKYHHMVEISHVRHVASGKVTHKVQETLERPPVSEVSPIGMFDSGVGGLTVFERTVKLMPRESIIYLADEARVPYGGRSPSEIIKINKEILGYLAGLGVKLIMIACGTSSSIAYPVLKDKYKVPIVELIQGGAKMAKLASRNKKVGVIATVGTVNSGAYEKALKALDKDMQVFSVACPLLVPLIEGGFSSSDETLKVLREYLKPLIREKVDTLILGCTHYPHLSGLIKDILGGNISLIDPGEEAARTAVDILNKGKMTAAAGKPPEYRFLTTGSLNSFKELGSRLLGRPLTNVEEITLVKAPSGR